MQPSDPPSLLSVFDHLGGGSHLHLHPTEGLVAYDGGSCVMIWEVLDDVKLRVHEHLNPVKIVKFFGEESTFVFSSDYRSIIISEWHSLKRVAELNIPLKKGDSPSGDMLMDYRQNTMVLLTRLQKGYRLTILTFREFTLQFVFSADMLEGAIPVSCGFLQLDRLCKTFSHPGVIVVEENSVKIWDLEEDFLVTRHQVSIHKPVLQTVLLEEKREIVLLLEQGLVVTLNHKLEFTHKMSLGEPGISKVVKWSEDTLVFFADDSRLYLYDWTKKRAVQDIYLREKVDMYCIENFGDLENRILDGEYKVAHAHISGSLFFTKNAIQ